MERKIHPVLESFVDRTPPWLALLRKKIIRSRWALQEKDRSSFGQKRATELHIRFLTSLIAK